MEKHQLQVRVSKSMLSLFDSVQATFFDEEDN